MNDVLDPDLRKLLANRTYYNSKEKRRIFLEARVS